MFNKKLERSAALRRNITLTVALRLLMGCMAFMVSTIVLLWQRNGMNMQQITLLQAIFAVALALFEVPTGYFADSLGRKTSVIVATLMLTAGSSMYFLSAGFTGFLAAELVLAAGFSFLSGADQALLYDSLLELGREAEFAKLWGRASFWTFGVSAVAAIIGGYVGAIDLQLPMLMEAVSMALTFLVALPLIEPRRAKDKADRRASIRDLLAVFAEGVRTSSGLRWLLLYPALIGGLTQVAVWLYAPYFALSGVPVQYFGWIFASFNVVAAIASRYADRINRACGEKWSMVLPLALLVASYLLLSNFVFMLSFCFAMLQQFVRGYSQVVFPQQLNARISSERRATLLSLQSMTTRLAYAVMLLPIGFMADHGGVLFTMQVAGIGTAVLGGLALVSRYARG